MSIPVPANTTCDIYRSGNAPPTAPCHGPACDRQHPPAAPPAPPAPTVGPQTHSDAILPAADPADPDRPAAAPGDPAPVPTHLPSAIFHPPRLPV